MADFKLPELGEDITEAEVIRVLVAEGDTIRADQNVMEVESEKAATGLPCPVAGKIAKIHVKEGQTVKVGQTLLTVEEKDAKEKEAPAQEKKTTPPSLPSKTEERGREKPEKVAVRAQTEGDQSPADEQAKEEKQAPKTEMAARTKETSDGAAAPAGPATRQLARELGVSLQQLQGTGPQGRITREDVERAARSPAAPGAGASSLHVPPLPDFSRWGAVRRQRLSKTARTSAQRLQLSWQLIPHVTQHEVTDVTRLEAMRRRHNEEHAQAGPKLTMTVLVVKAVVAALKSFPHFNSSFDQASGELIIKEYFHIGIAVDTEEGLLVPVLRDADRKNAGALATELAELAEKARHRQLKADEMQGSTFTISNLGGIAGTAFTPIINYPEVAILGLAQARWQPYGKKMKSRLLLPLSLSYDHRAIDGAAAARFIRLIAQFLSEPFHMFMQS